MSDLRRQFDALLDESISPEDLATLTARLHDDADARAAWADYIHLHTALLCEHTQPLHRATPKPDDESSSRRGTGFKLPTYIAAAALIALTLTAWFTLVPSAPHDASPTTTSSIAMLTSTDSAVFADAQTPLHLGADLSPGPIQLLSGSAQVIFGSGAVVDLTGPCTFVMTDRNRGRLVAGAMQAYVPDRAHGFIVDLPDRMRLTDLGTAFKTRIDPAGGIEVRVTEGRVRVDRPNKKPVTLAAGAVCMIDDQTFAFSMALPIVNASFEDDRANRIGGELPHGWTSAIDGRAGCENHTANGNFTTGVEGQFVGLVNFHLTGDPPDTASALVQTTDVRIDVACTYTLTAAVGRRLDHDTRQNSPTRWQLALCDADTGRVLASSTGVVAQSGVMTDQHLTYRPAESDAGLRLQIRLINPQNTHTDPSPGQTNFDNIRLTQWTPMPGASLEKTR